MSTSLPSSVSQRDHFAEMLARTGPNRLDPYAGSMADAETLEHHDVHFDQTIAPEGPIVLLEVDGGAMNGGFNLTFEHQDFERVLIEMRGWWNRLRRIYAEEDWSRLDPEPVAVLQQGASE